MQRATLEIERWLSAAHTLIRQPRPDERHVGVRLNLLCLRRCHADCALGGARATQRLKEINVLKAGVATQALGIYFYVLAISAPESSFVLPLVSQRQRESNQAHQCHETVQKELAMPTKALTELRPRGHPCTSMFGLGFWILVSLAQE